MIRLYLDEQVDPIVAAGLARRGFEVTTTAQTNLMGSSDEQQLEYAATNGKVIITHDSDFVRLHRAGVEHAVIFYCHQMKYTAGQMLREILAIARTTSAEELQNELRYL